MENTGCSLGCGVRVLGAKDGQGLLLRSGREAYPTKSKLIQMRNRGEAPFSYLLQKVLLCADKVSGTWSSFQILLGCNYKSTLRVELRLSFLIPVIGFETLKIIRMQFQSWRCFSSYGDLSYPSLPPWLRPSPSTYIKYRSHVNNDLNQVYQHFNLIQVYQHFN